MSESLYAEIALDMPVKELADKLFTYEIPLDLKHDVFIGTQVLVPFGKQDLVTGWVVSLKDDQSSESAKTRPITEVLDGEPLFDRNYIDYLYWIADYYAATLADVLQAAIPKELVPRWKRMMSLSDAPTLSAQLAEQMLSPDEKEIVDCLSELPHRTGLVKSLKDRLRLPPRQFYKAVSHLKSQGIVSFSQLKEEAAKPKTALFVTSTGEPAQSKRHIEILGILKDSGGQLPLASLAKKSGASATTIRKMEATGSVTIAEQELFRDPLKSVEAERVTPPQLTAAQQAACQTLGTELEKKFQRTDYQKDQPVPWLLHGVTGSGKTEVYLRLIQQALDNDRTAILLVPEISLTPQLAQRLSSRFPGLVAVWHSALSAGERFDTWRRLESGELKVLLGARSAILMRMNNLGLIILDEEHDGSYKQSTPSPRYSARHLALERGRRENCFVLFGSATPDAVTFAVSRQAGTIVELPGRVLDQKLPESVIVDMRHELTLGNRSIFSGLLRKEIEACLFRKEQTILLINRRGFASHVFCRACGHVMKCRNCSVSLVYHSFARADAADLQHAHASMSAGRLTCHHCNFNRESTEICPACDAPFLRQSGVGTQKVEIETRAAFPEARILRLDSDITTRKGAYEEIFKQFSAGEADILIGTQMIAKGIDIARVTLVGVLSADAVFNLPDYRSLERGFQLLTQVSGRAGRGTMPGKVVLQTFNPQLPALDLARRQDYHAFIENELQSRLDFGYPPASQLIRIVLAGEYPRQVEAAADELCEALSVYLEDLASDHEIKILGPAPCLIEKIKNFHRHHILIKNLKGDQGRALVVQFLKGRKPTGYARITIDIDPIDLI